MDLEFAKTISMGGNWKWGTSFCNVKLACNPFVFHLMSNHLAENPQIKMICELGTHTAGMALYLGMESVRLGIPFHTWDIEKQTTADTDKILDRLGVIQHIGDVFEQEAEILKLIGDEPVMLICDSGNKCREVERFAPRLPKYSIISSHDYGEELKDDCLSWTYEHVHMMPIRAYEWGETNAQFPTWKIMSEPIKDFIPEPAAEMQEETEVKP
jgi:hypothetical protein